MQSDEDNDDGENQSDKGLDDDNEEKVTKKGINNSFELRKNLTYVNDAGKRRQKQ